MQINGIHHVTAIAGPALRNFDFYTRALGLVKIHLNSSVASRRRISAHTARL